jgi:predicted Rossmann fold nucleotide-binding protein DprA/Smf involved in DNA uptake
LIKDNNLLLKIIKYKNILSYFGNKNILRSHKTAFLCSRKCPSDVVIKSLDWARDKKNNGDCIISGFHSRIEKDVFNILLKGKQPIILVLARGMKKYWPEEIKKAIEEERLLVISPFTNNVKYITQETANIRNEIMTEIADEIFIAYYTPNGNLHKLIKNLKGNKIKIF